MKYYWRITWSAGYDIKEYRSSSYMLQYAWSEAMGRGASDNNTIKIERINEEVS